ncbi:MAG: metallophosphoesterase [Bacteroidota bacterium]
MSAYSIDLQSQATFNDINEKFETAVAEKGHLLETRKEADHFWEYLKQCESYLIGGKLKELDYTHDMENILALYHLNDLIDKGHLTPHLRTSFGLPASEVTEEMFDEQWNLAGWVAGDGTIYAISKYCQLDYKWTLVLAYYYYYKAYPEKKHPFVSPAQPLLNTPVDLIPPSATIAIIGDWGTGKWEDGHSAKCPAELVIEGVLSLQPDYIIHLGDVYYAGTEDEEKTNFLGMLAESYPGKVYTMNSNHEMYDGANGLMGTTLTDPRFAHQGGSTYFSLEIGDWILVGLDSAYYDNSDLYMEGSLMNTQGGQEQLDLLKKAYNTNKQLLVLTHHNGIEITKHGSKLNQTLWNQVAKTLTPHLPDAWYWGHVHNAVIYNDDISVYGGKTAKNGNKPRMRCCGHASIPNGNGSYLERLSSGSNPDVEFYSKTDMQNPTTEVQKLRVLNGFALIEINGSDFSESFYEVSNEYSGPKKVWYSN